jgi:predicted transcriptional regulator
MDGKVWKDVREFEGVYQVSSCGQVRNIQTGHIKHHDTSRLYKAVCLYKKGRGYKRMVHRLVAEVFCAKLEGCDVVNHLDGDKWNNHYTNLEWTTPSGNAQHAVRTGLTVVSKGDNAPQAKLSSDDVLDIIELAHSGVSQTEIASLFGVHRVAISKIVIGKNWNDLNSLVDKSKLNKACSRKKIADQNGVVYTSIMEAAEKLKLSIGNISMVLHGIRKHTKNYRFTFVKE